MIRSDSRLPGGGFGAHFDLTDAEWTNISARRPLVALSARGVPIKIDTSPFGIELYLDGFLADGAADLDIGWQGQCRLPAPTSSPPWCAWGFPPELLAANNPCEACFNRRQIQWEPSMSGS
jgi:hypothetical protein